MKGNQLVFGLMASLGRDEYSFTELERLVAPFDVSVMSMRVVLSRMVRGGVLRSRREGRNAFYRFSEKGIRIRSNVSFSFHQLNWSDWNEDWWGVLFSIPEKEKNIRHRIRKKLIAYRFALQFPGFWIRPLHPKEQCEKYLGDTLEHCRLIRFRPNTPFKNDEIYQLWDLGSCMKIQTKALTLLKSNLKKIDSYSPHVAFRKEILVGDRVVNALFADPMVPDRYLPDHWPATELRTRFFEWSRKIRVVSKTFWGPIINIS